MAKEDLDRYYTDKFIKHRKVFDWIDQFTNQFRQMGLIGDTDGDSISFKRELLAIIKKEAKPDWNLNQKHDEKRYPEPAKQGYGIMACTYNCNDAVQEYWEEQDQTHANSWGFGGVKRNKNGDVIKDTEKYPVRVTDYADIKTGKVIDPKKAMYRGAMYYAILRNKEVKKHPPKNQDEHLSVLAKAFERYNGSGSRARNYSKQAMEYYDGMTKLAKKADRGSHGEFWDKGNIKQKKGQSLAQGLAGSVPAVWDDVKSTVRNWGSPSDRQTGKGTVMRAIDQISSDKKDPGDWNLDLAMIGKGFADPAKQALGNVGDAYRNALNSVQANIGPKYVSDAEREAENLAKIEARKKDRKESIEESTEQEILAKFAKEILGLDISDEQMQQVIQQLDITDVVGIKRAIESGDFEGLHLGESRLKEYHSNKGMADRAKQSRAMKEPTAQAAGPQLAPREPKKIAGNNANPEAPPTGASNSTRKPVPSMPKSQIAKNLVVTDPDTGEELNVTNDLAATQMMRRAKRVG